MDSSLKSPYFADRVHSKLTQNKGFTLPEIALTVGIVGFVLIPLFGLIALSANNTYDADTISISSSIATGLLGQAQQASQEQIDEWVTDGEVDSYYDLQGNEIDSSDDSNFTARMIIDDEGVDYGGSSPNLHASRIVVHVCSAPGTNGTSRLDEIQSDPSASRGNIRTYQTIRTNLEKIQ